MRQVLKFFHEAQLRERRRRHQRMCDFNAAFAGGQEGKKLFDALSKED